MSNILITGINGFVGKHLAHELQSQGHQVIGVSREPAIHPALANKVSAYYSCDITNAPSVARLPLETIDAVINLAGLAKVGDSYDNPELYHKVNVEVLLVIGNRLLDIGSKARLLAISTGAVYSSAQPMPLSEDSKLIEAGSPYALSKIAMEQEAERLNKAGLDCVVARPFNHIGPGQEGGFLVPDIYHKIAQGNSAGGNSIRVGDLSTKRDYTDVRDVVRAYVALVTTPKLQHLTYNVCSGRSISGQTILERILSECSKQNLRIEQDPALIRPNDPKDLYGSNDRLRQATGWTPTIPLNQTIHDYILSV